MALIGQALLLCARISDAQFSSVFIFNSTVYKHLLQVYVNQSLKYINNIKGSLLVQTVQKKCRVENQIGIVHRELFKEGNFQ